LPVVVAAHGAGDRPTWQCEVWREIVQDRGFVLCPQGTRMGWGQNLGFFFRHHHALEKEVLAALEALHARFGDRIAPGPVVYAGYSQGGTMGALMVVKHPHLFQRLVLVEGGEAEWDVPTATRFRQGGGQRVLLVCGRHPCAERARKSVGWLQKGGVDARLEHVPGGGHTYGGTVAERLLASFAWIVEGDPRWLP
jgi:predicted esterase